MPRELRQGRVPPVTRVLDQGNSPPRASREKTHRHLLMAPMVDMGVSCNMALDALTSNMRSGGYEGYMPQEYHGPFVRDWDFMLAIVRSDVCTCLLIVMENLNSRTLVEQETIGRATVHSIGRVIGVSPFSAATHPHNECCRGMASGDVLAAKCLAHSTRKGDLLFVLLRFLRGLMVFRDRRPHYYFGHDGPTGSSPLVISTGGPVGGY